MDEVPVGAVIVRDGKDYCDEDAINGKPVKDGNGTC